MASYWLDANVFIQAKNGPYGFDIAPAFWEAIEEFASRGLVRSSVVVRRELGGFGDDLSRWVASDKVKSSGLFMSPNRAVQSRLGEITQFVQTAYGPARAKHFLSGADPWVIAHALATNGFVVTWETLAGPNNQRVQIPNVCKQFNVQYINTYSLLRTLGIRFNVT